MDQVVNLGLYDASCLGYLATVQYYDSNVSILLTLATFFIADQQYYTVYEYIYPDSTVPAVVRGWCTTY